MVSDLPTNVRLGWKCPAVKNALAYLITTAKSIIVPVSSERTKLSLKNRFQQKKPEDAAIDNKELI